MPALAFQVDALVEPSPHRAVQELCAFAREDNTSNHAVLALHNMPIQIQDGPISHHDGGRGTIQVVLQLKPATGPKDIPALNVMGVCWCSAAERNPKHPEQHHHPTGQATPPPHSLLNHLGPSFQCFKSLTEVVQMIHVLILQGLG
jgi:hypothetical protein